MACEAVMIEKGNKEISSCQKWSSNCVHIFENINFFLFFYKSSI